jgi:hypothetical protein
LAVLPETGPARGLFEVESGLVPHKHFNQHRGMPKLLSIVTDCFALSGRCCVVVVPGIPREGDWRVNLGDLLTLKRPDGTTEETVVAGIEIASRPHPDFIPMLLRPGLTKEAVPVGTEIWID